MKKLIKRLCCAVLCLAFLWSSIPVNVYATASYDLSQQGSIQIQLQDIGTTMSGTEFAIHQVGTVTSHRTLQFELTPGFSSAGVDLNSLHYASDQKAATTALVSAISGPALATGTANSSGLMTFSNLSHGVYLICQTNEASYGTIEPFLVYIPYMSNTNDGWIYDVTVTPKAEASTPGTGKIIINKKVVNASNAVKTVEETFYFTIYSDQAMTTIIRTQPLSLAKASSGSVAFDNLAYGTYYVAESDKDGKAVGASYAYDVTVDSAAVTLSAANQESTVNITNKEKRTPVVNPEQASLEITKTVTGSAGNKTKAFTFTIVLTDADGNELPGTYEYIIDDNDESAKIKSGGTIKLAHGQKAVFYGIPEGTKYKITESDNAGYTVTEENTSGTISGENQTAAFTNSKGSTPNDTTKKDTTTKKIISNVYKSVVNSVKTADTTTIMLWVLTAIAGMAGIILLVVRRKRSGNK